MLRPQLYIPDFEGEHIRNGCTMLMPVSMLHTCSGPMCPTKSAEYESVHEMAPCAQQSLPILTVSARWPFTSWDWTAHLQLHQAVVIAIAASSSVMVQVLDKAFMSGVLLMTAFWSVAAATDHKRAPADTTSSTKATTSPAVVALGPATAEAGPTATAAGPATTAVGQAATEPGGAVTARPHATAAAPDGPMIEEHGVEQSSSSLVAAELLDSMSYLQFCRMKLTAYNTLLKNVLTSVSTSAEVG